MRSRSGDARSLARLLTLVESGTAVDGVRDVPRSAQVVGVTGPPGAGKSTLVGRLITACRDRGQRVAVLAVDPSSPFTGGALLGDRIRFTDFADDDDVFIRSMASRGHLGGLSVAAPAAIDVLATVGFDIVLVETVGVGQSEVEVLGVADMVLVVLAPAAGDHIQAAKAGILEIADVLVVNKADLPGAARTARDLRAMIPGVPVLLTAASTGEGIDALVAALVPDAKILRAADSPPHEGENPPRGGF